MPSSVIDYRAPALRAVALLQELETVSTQDEGAHCPSCQCLSVFTRGGGTRQEHDADCELASVLALAKTLEPA